MPAKLSACLLEGTLPESLGILGCTASSRASNCVQEREAQLFREMRQSLQKFGASPTMVPVGGATGCQLGIHRRRDLGRTFGCRNFRQQSCGSNLDGSIKC